MILELSLIKEDKLKVLLTPFDMMKYELTCETLDYDDTKTRKAIWSILDFAKNETGFDAAIGKIRIEVYPEKSGGCAIYITKLKKSEAPIPTDMKENLAKIPADTRETTPAVYRFSDLESLLGVCRSLFHCGYREASDAFFEVQPTGMTRFFLRLEETSAPLSKKAKYLRENLFILEFGERLEYDEAVLYLAEHCGAICKERAVQTLSAI